LRVFAIKVEVIGLAQTLLEVAGVSLGIDERLRQMIGRKLCFDGLRFMAVFKRNLLAPFFNVLSGISRIGF